MILDKRADLRHGDVKKLLFSLSVPTITSQIVNMLYNLVDRVFIGHMQPAETVGKLALTGVGVCLPTIMVISAFAALTAIGGAPRASIAEGAGESEKSERIMGNCLTMLVITALVLTVLFESFAEPLLLMFGASENTIGYALDYMRIYALGTIFVQLTLGMNAYITAQGFATVSMKTVLIGALLNTALDPLFIFVLGLGVRGAALATVISQAVSAVWVMTFLTGKKTRWYLKRENLHVDVKIVLPCIALGLSPFVMQSTESLIAICFNSSLLRYGGDMAVGTMTVLTSIMQFSNMPLQGLTQGAQPIVSYNFGAKNTDRVRETFHLLLKVCLIYSVSLWLLIELFPGLFARIFTPDAELIAFTARVLRIYCAGLFLFGIQIACQMTFVSIGSAVCSIIVAVLRKFVLLLPLIYLLPALLPDQTTAVYLAEPVADVIAVTCTAILFATQFRKALHKLEANA